MTGHSFRAVALAASLAVAGCFGPGTPEEQLQAIEELQAKNLPMTEEQTSELSDKLAKGRAALAAGDKEQAGKSFEAALAILKLAEDTALYNKAN